MAPIWTFTVGSQLCGTTTESSDVDVLVVSKAVRGLWPERADAGPQLLRHEGACFDVRVCSPGFLRVSVLTGRKWAWEIWSTRPAGLDDEHRRLAELLMASRYHVEALPKAYAVYRTRYLPEALSNNAQEASDYRAWFDKSGWHHKIGYYLSLNAIFSAQWPSCGFDVERLVALKEGSVSREEWLDEWVDLDKAALARGEKADTDYEALSEWSVAFTETWGL